MLNCHKPSQLHAGFTVTDEEFAGCSPSECFALGIEFAQLWDHLRRGVGGTFLLHAVNQARLDALCSVYGTTYHLDEISAEGMCFVTVHLPLERRKRNDTA